MDLVEDDVALGERPGLVEADDVDAGEPLDGGQLLHEHLPPGELHGSDGEGDARHEHESERDHRDDRRDRAHRGISPRTGVDRLLPAAGANIWALRTSRATGPMSQVIHGSTRSIEERSSLGMSENRFASLAKRFAKESAPTRARRA